MRSSRIATLPALIVVALFAVAAITNDSRWTYAAYGFGAGCVVVANIVAWDMRRDERQAAKNRR